VGIPYPKKVKVLDMTYFFKKVCDMNNFWFLTIKKEFFLVFLGDASSINWVK
jgi:hypothetical protein